MGKLIVFEGIDGSGKSTQFRLLCQRLRQEGREFRNLTFPQYDQPSSTLIRMYLGGAFGSDPGKVNAYAASSFFAVDRFASFVNDWGDWYAGGGTIITDRYTTSNAIHQAGKLTGQEREDYFRWLYEYEFTRMGMPEPELVLYIHAPVELCIQRLRQREEQTNTSADIHEQDADYLRRCHDCGLEAAKHYGWQVIEAVGPSGPRGIEEIAAQVYDAVSTVLA